MKKRVISCLLASTMVCSTLLLGGCGEKEPQQMKETEAAVQETQVKETGKEETEKEETAKEPQTITFSHSQGEWMWPTYEAIAKKYEEQTGNKVEIIYVAHDGYSTWQTAQFVAESEPDIITGAVGVKDLFENGKIMELTEYYQEENPYTGRIWFDDYIPGMLDDCKDISGTKYIANGTSRTAPQLFYNKDIFRELGLGEEAPRSWSEVLEICKKVEADGRYIPFSAMNSIRWSLDWPVFKCLEDLYINSDVLEKLDIINENDKLDTAEILLGFETGILDYEDPRFVEYFRLMKDFAKYLNKGFNTASWEFESLFNEGKVAMTFNGGWYPGQHIEKGLTLDYGVAPLPYVDTGYSEYGRAEDGKYIGKLAEPTVVITQKCKEEGRAEVAVDFLKFLAAADGGAQLLADGTFLMPVVKDVEVPDVLKELQENTGTDIIHYNLNVALQLNAESGDKFWKSFAMFLENDQTPEDFAKDVKKLMMPYVEQEIEDRPDLKVMDYVDKVQK